MIDDRKQVYGETRRLNVEVYCLTINSSKTGIVQYHKAKIEGILQRCINNTVLKKDYPRHFSYYATSCTLRYLAIQKKKKRESILTVHAYNQ